MTLESMQVPMMVPVGPLFCLVRYEGHTRGCGGNVSRYQGEHNKCLCTHATRRRREAIQDFLTGLDA